MAFSLLRIPRAHTTLTYRSQEGIAFANLTESVSRAVSASGVKEGFALIKNHGVGSLLFVQEAEQQVEQDLLARLSGYEAQKAWQSLFQPYQALPIIDGKLKLGRYQSILTILMCDEQTPNFSVTPVPGRLETIAIDTGTDDYPVLHESKKSDYASKGSEKILDITGEIRSFARRFGKGAGVIVVGTGNTTAEIFCETRSRTISDLVKDIGRLDIPDFSYGHNRRELRHNIPPDERMNGFSHLACALLLRTSVLFPPSGPSGKVCLVDMDAPRNNRVLYVAVAELHYNALSV